MKHSLMLTAELHIISSGVRKGKKGSKKEHALKFPASQSIPWDSSEG